jgi:protein-disulfide isomerase
MESFMLKIIRLALIACLLSAVPTLAAEFNPAQKNELNAIIHDYLLKNPEVVREALQELERRQTEAEDNARKSAIAAKAPTIFHQAGDLVGGNPNGKITMVEFFDYNCGYCRKAFPDVMRMLEEDKDLRLVMKEFPILGPGSTYAARAALASRKQGKYWEYHLALMRYEGHIDEASADAVAQSVGLDVARLKADMASDDITSVIKRNMSLADALNIQGTPAFVVDERIIPGAIGYDGLAAAVKEVRDGGGCQSC